jgi:hypothetical protein
MKFTGFKVLQSVSFWIETQIHIIRGIDREPINWLLFAGALSALTALGVFWIFYF